MDKAKYAQKSEFIGNQKWRHHNLKFVVTRHVGNRWFSLEEMYSKI